MILEPSLVRTLVLYTLMEIRETAGRVFIDNKRSAHQEIPPDVHPITGAPLLVSDINDPGCRSRTMNDSPDSLAPPHPLPDDPAILTLYGYLPLTCFRNGLDTCATCAKVAFGPPSYLQRLLSDALALIPPTHAAPSAPT